MYLSHSDEQRCYDEIDEVQADLSLIRGLRTVWELVFEYCSRIEHAHWDYTHHPIHVRRHWKILSLLQVALSDAVQNWTVNTANHRADEQIEQTQGKIAHLSKELFRHHITPFLRQIPVLARIANVGCVQHHVESDLTFHR